VQIILSLNSQGVYQSGRCRLKLGKPRWRISIQFGALLINAFKLLSRRRAAAFDTDFAADFRAERFFRGLIGQLGLNRLHLIEAH